MKAGLVVIAVAAPAWAEPAPDPAAAQVGEANLESTASRKGYVVTLAVGGAVTLGFGVNDSTGTGGAGTLRLAYVATPRTLVTIELAGSALFHQVKMGTETETYTNQVTNLLVGAQVYANAALWFRIAGGFGRYLGDEVLLDAAPGTPQRRGDLRLAGPAVAGGAGVDIARFWRFRLGAEIQATGMLNREGLLSSGGFLIGLTFD